MLTAYEPGTAPSFLAIVVNWKDPSFSSSAEASAPGGVLGWNVTTPARSGSPLASSTRPRTGYATGGGVELKLAPHPTESIAPIAPAIQRRCHIVVSRSKAARGRSRQFRATNNP